MTAEEYRQRMIQAFHNADCDELIAICVLPTAKEFEHLEWLLKNHYKKEPCEDAINRQAAIDLCDWYDNPSMHDDLEKLPSAQPQLPEWAQKVEEYRQSAPSHIHNPLAWALYQTWKEYDR